MARYIYPATTPKYYPKQRTVGGERGTLLPYTSGDFLKPCKGPRGGKAYKRCYRQLWWAGGKVCKIARVLDERGEWHHMFKPFTGGCWNRHDHSEKLIHTIDDGILVKSRPSGKEDGWK